jgi:hypothetical protein
LVLLISLNGWDVGLQMEDIARVVGGLNLLEPVIFRVVCTLDTVLVVFGHEVHITPDTEACSTNADQYARDQARSDSKSLGVTAVA